MSRRVVVTGLGTINPLGHSVREYWDGLLAGRSGVGPITLMDTSTFKVRFAAEVKNFLPADYWPAFGPDEREAHKVIKHTDRFAQFALVAAHEAVKDSGVEFANLDPYRCGTIIGSGIGGLNEFHTQHQTFIERGPARINPFTIPKMMANAASGVVSIRYGLMGPNTAVSTACSSASHAMTDAFHQIKLGRADVMVSGGSEAAIAPMGLGGFIACRALSNRSDDPQGASRPFDKDRDGFVLGEGAGMVILEEYEHARARGAQIYCEVLGTGNTGDAFHITAPHEEGLGASRSMTDAAREAEVPLDAVGYVNAHGTSTPLGDAGETRAMKKVFGPHASQLMVSSTKSMIGHLLGASGGAAIVACALTLKKGVVHPTINYQTPDPECDLDYVPNAAREIRVKYLMANSFGFGGHNSTMLLGAI